MLKFPKLSQAIAFLFHFLLDVILLYPPRAGISVGFA